MKGYFSRLEEVEDRTFNGQKTHGKMLTIPGHKGNVN
jgi:hypothetical protein